MLVTIYSTESTVNLLNIVISVIGDDWDIIETVAVGVPIV